MGVISEEVVVKPHAGHGAKQAAEQASHESAAAPTAAARSASPAASAATRKGADQSDHQPQTEQDDDPNADVIAPGSLLVIFSVCFRIALPFAPVVPGWRVVHQASRQFFPQVLCRLHQGLI